MSLFVYFLEESTQRYNISATKDGQVFGNELPLRVFDSTCLDCDILGCEVKVSILYKCPYAVDFMCV